MASVYKEIDVDVAPGQVWDVIRDVGAVHKRLLPGRVINTQIEGNIRTLTFPDQRMTRELIITVDDTMRRLAYAVIETGLPFTFHHATFQVFAAEKGQTRLVWITDLLPDSCTEYVRVRMEYGARDMKQAIEHDAEERCQIRRE
jgi:hypothetical protein